MPHPWSNNAKIANWLGRLHLGGVAIPPRLQSPRLRTHGCSRPLTGLSHRGELRTTVQPRAQAHRTLLPTVLMLADVALAPYDFWAAQKGPRRALDCIRKLTTVKLHQLPLSVLDLLNTRARAMIACEIPVLGSMLREAASA